MLQWLTEFLANQDKILSCLLYFKFFFNIFIFYFKLIFFLVFLDHFNIFIIKIIKKIKKYYCNIFLNKK